MAFNPITTWFSRVCGMRGDRVACEYRGGTVTYAALDDRSNRIADALLEDSEWKHESIVAILVRSPLDALTAILATMKAGGAFAPLDALTPAKRLAQMFEDALPAYIVTDAEHAALAATLSLPLSPAPRSIDLSDLQASRAPDRAPRRDAVHHAPDDLAYLYFTSGSSGGPKPIAGRLKAIDHFVRWEIETFAVDADSRISQVTNVAFDAYLRDVFVPLCAGGTVCVPLDRSLVWQPSGFADWIEASRLTHLHCVPSMFRSLLQAPLNSERFRTLKYVLLAGEPLLSSDVEKWMSVFHSRIRLVNLYGPSETTMTKLFHVVTDADRQTRGVPIGRPMPGAAVLVIDEAQSPCGPDVVGEIWIRTPFRAHGYYKRPHLTARAFIPNPFSDDPDDIVYRTGDLGRMREDGELEIIGRTDEQVKVRGARIELSEIEDVLRRCEAVSDAAVVACDDATSLRAFVILREEGTLHQVRRHLVEWLPSQMIPSDITACETFPRTTTGKVDRRRLAELRAPSHDADDDPTPATLPWHIGQLWGEVLNVPRVGLQDNFFRLGGHSLMVAQMLGRLRHRLGVDASMADLFLAPTLGSFAMRIQESFDSQTARVPVRITTNRKSSTRRRRKSVKAN